MVTAVEIATSHAYSIGPWDTFFADPDLPKGLLDRAIRTKSECEERGEIVTHVLYDKNDDEDGFLILGNDPEEMCKELADGPLECDDRWGELFAQSSRL